MKHTTREVRQQSFTRAGFWLRSGLILGLLLTQLAVAGTTMNRPSGDRQAVTRLLVQFPGHEAVSPSADLSHRLDQMAVHADIGMRYLRPMSGQAHVIELDRSMSRAEARQLAATLMARGLVAHAEPELRFTIWRQPAIRTVTPDDPLFTQQWHFQFSPGTAEGINAAAAWDVGTGDPGTVIAVIDTGILVHEDLNPARILPGYNFVSDPDNSNDGQGRGPDPTDPGDWAEADQCFPGSPAHDSSWHGLHVTGIIAATSNNAVGVSGTDWNAGIVPIRALGTCGGVTSDLADAIRWAAGLEVPGVPDNEHPATIINMSFGVDESCSNSQILRSAINNAVIAGAFPVVAAGNDNADVANYSPASCSNVIAVAATNAAGNRAAYSNFGAGIHISAPGGETADETTLGVLSTHNSGATTAAADSYAFLEGTSMATPQVSGTLGLMLPFYPGLTIFEARDLLQMTSRPFPVGSNCDTDNCGAGIVDAHAALTFSYDCSTVQVIPVSECEALADLYAATNGDDWKNNTGWLRRISPCNWSGVGCSSGHVLGLNLSTNRMAGTLPDSLADLSELRTLDLHNSRFIGDVPDHNHIEGSIPSTLGNLPNLVNLLLSSNQFSGPVPPELGQLSSLRILNLGHNHLEGEIPASLGLLTELRTLNLAHNELVGEIPLELADLPNLQILSLNDNLQLSGPMPPELGNLSSLRELRLSFTQLAGELPPEIGQLAQLRILDLFHTFTHGTLPPEIGALAQLQELDVGLTGLGGRIPDEFGNLTNLQSFRANGSGFTGHLPQSLRGLQNLRGINLADNFLCGPLPHWFGELSQLQSIRLQGNALSGPLPMSLIDLNHVFTFDFSRTELCEPPDPDFQAWLDDIWTVNSSDLTCEANSDSLFIDRFEACVAPFPF